MGQAGWVDLVPVCFRKQKPKQFVWHKLRSDGDEFRTMIIGNQVWLVHHSKETTIELLSVLF